MTSLVLNNWAQIANKNVWILSILLAKTVPSDQTAKNEQNYMW